MEEEKDSKLMREARLGFTLLATVLFMGLVKVLLLLAALLHLTPG